MQLVSWSLRGAALLALGVLLFARSHEARATGSLPLPFDASLVDANKNACTDFFAYATSKWRDAHPLPAEYTEYGYIEALQNQTQTILKGVLEAARPAASDGSSATQKIGALYGSCMDAAAIERAGLRPIEPELRRIDALQSANQLPAEIARLHQMGVDVVFAVIAVQDLKHSDRVIAEIDQSGLGLPERDYYLRSDANSKKLRVQYAAHVAKMLTFSGDTAGRAGAARVMSLETRLAQGSVPAAQLRDPESVYHPMSETSAASLTPHFALRTYWSDASIPASVINVAEPGFQSTVDTVVRTVPLAAWRSYLRYHLVSDYADQLPSRIAEESFDFNGRILNGLQRQQPRWKRCERQVDRYLGEDLGKAYVARTFSREARQRALDMTLRIRSAYADEMEHLPWMTEATKKTAEAKLAAMGLKIGYPDIWRSYAGYTLVANDYFGNVARGRSFARTYDLEQIGKAVDRSRWSMTPQTVNAYNDTSRNEIVLPAAQLQPPFFASDASDAANLGATGGSTIGHEMTHGFDDEGHKFDLHGNLRNWWTVAEAKAFDERANCVISQFNNTLAVPGVHYQGKLVAGEAIADLGGATIAYHALEQSLQGKERAKIDGFTPEQAYFIAYAQSWTESNRPEAARNLAMSDPHPLPRERVNLTVENIPGWYQAFNCPMPPKICTVW